MTDVIPSDGDKPKVVDDGSPEGHVAKMLAMGDGNPAPKEGEEGYVVPTGDQVATRPDDVPEKFWDAEKGVINTAALLKSQADAEAALRGKKPDGELTDEEKAAAETAKAAEEAAKTAEANPKVVADATAEFAKDGKLSDETYTALDGVGLSKELVDSYIAGQTAIVGNLRGAAYAPFEGQEGYERAANWAAETLTDGEIEALDVQLLSNNPAIIKAGAEALAARYAAEADVEPNTIRGDGNTNTVGGVYKSSREMMKDMNSNKYKTSQAFRDEVAAKLSRSNL